MLATPKTDSASSIVELRLGSCIYGATSDAHGVDRFVDETLQYIHLAGPERYVWDDGGQVWPLGC